MPRVVDDVDALVEAALLGGNNELAAQLLAVAVYTRPPRPVRLVPTNLFGMPTERFRFFSEAPVRGIHIHQTQQRRTRSDPLPPPGRGTYRPPVRSSGTLRPSGTRAAGQIPVDAALGPQAQRHRPERQQPLRARREILAYWYPQKAEQQDWRNRVFLGKLMGANPASDCENAAK